MYNVHRTTFEKNKRREKTIFHQQLQCISVCVRSLLCALHIEHSNDMKLIFSRFNLLGLETMTQIYYRIFMIIFSSALSFFSMQICATRKGKFEWDFFPLCIISMDTWKSVDSFAQNEYFDVISSFFSIEIDRCTFKMEMNF